MIDKKDIGSIKIRTTEEVESLFVQARKHKSCTVLQFKEAAMADLRFDGLSKAAIARWTFRKLSGGA
jgi:hypothetical protein